MFGGGGGGGLNPRKMEQMMKQMGIDVDELDAEEVIIRTADAELVFENPDVTKMDARGQATYQVIGTPDERERGADDAGDATAVGGDTASDAADVDVGTTVPDDDSEERSSSDPAVEPQDVEIVAMRTGASEDEARESLEKHDGDLAAAVEELE